MSLVVDVVAVAFTVYSWLIIGRIILSWVRHNPYNPAVRFIYDLTDPYLNIFRRVIPPIGMIDISPIAALLVLQLLRGVIMQLLRSVGF
ncbi:MAG: YggT family protein [Candidatus Desulforudis sp.]|nr:YggT family protein [Desulforudis sp.]